MTSLVSLVTKELRNKKQYTNSISFLNNLLEPADVIIVRGERLISSVIRVVTDSEWSHNALYEGNGKLLEADDILYRNGEPIPRSKKKIRRNPLEKYAHNRIIIGRAKDLSREKKERVVAFMQGHLGDPYDRENIHNHLLNRLLVNVPGRTYSPYDNLGSDNPHENTCSSMLARAFQSENYLINPVNLSPEGEPPVYKMKHPSQLVPEDFVPGRSEFFEIIYLTPDPIFANAPSLVR